MKKQQIFDISHTHINILQYFVLMFSFEKVFSDILKIYKRIYIYNEISNYDQNHLSQNNNLPGKFYAPTACDF